MKLYKRKNFILLVVLHIILAIGALFNGRLLIIFPSGELMGLS